MAPGSGQSGHPIDENDTQKTMVWELNWSADTKLLAAAISDHVAILDMSKILQRTPMLPMQTTAINSAMGAL